MSGERRASGGGGADRGAGRVDVAGPVAGEGLERQGPAGDGGTPKLDALRVAKGHTRGCRGCGQNPTVAHVFVSLRRRKPGRNGAGEQLDSRSLSLCEDCAVELWSKVKAALP